jgi:hypothetical protein
LQKIVYERDATEVHNNTTYTFDATTITDYIGGFIYESKDYSSPPPGKADNFNQLQFVQHEEGRAKPKKGSNRQREFVYDYFIKDHLGNVRMVLTEEEKQIIYPASTLETSLLNVETGLYNIDQTYIKPNSAANYLRDVNQQPQEYFNNNTIENPNPDCSGNTCTIVNSEFVYQLNGNDNKTGLGITLRVMAGDVIDIHGKSYYHDINPGAVLPIINK